MITAQQCLNTTTFVKENDSWNERKADDPVLKTWKSPSDSRARVNFGCWVCASRRGLRRKKKLRPFCGFQKPSKTLWKSMRKERRKSSDIIVAREKKRHFTPDNEFYTRAMKKKERSLFFTRWWKKLLTFLDTSSLSLSLSHPSSLPLPPRTKTASQFFLIERSRGPSYPVEEETHEVTTVKRKRQMLFAGRRSCRQSLTFFATNTREKKKLHSSAPLFPPPFPWLFSSPKKCKRPRETRNTRRPVSVLCFNTLKNAPFKKSQPERTSPPNYEQCPVWSFSPSLSFLANSK